MKVEYKDLRYIAGAKALLLRTYYDMEEYEAFLALANSFNQYLKRNKLYSNSRRRGFSNLIKFARQAFQLKMELDFLNDEKQISELKKLKQGN